MSAITLDAILAPHPADGCPSAMVRNPINDRWLGPPARARSILDLCWECCGRVVRLDPAPPGPVPAATVQALHDQARDR